ncbi:hypothetical protein BD310DRAFT_932417 [Dichomitus squalens]|uniref:Uncharacterized protein n=1 Tax=Dichomitus squalens TaxID=114155 RepID=A0A4Q9PP50_9APHY|nr:hypothetical protein BD310DRAFT_932417 [Dichomitus squalens]
MSSSSVGRTNSRMRTRLQIVRGSQCDCLLHRSWQEVSRRCTHQKDDLLFHYNICSSHPFRSPQKLDNMDTYWPKSSIPGGKCATVSSIYHRCSPEDERYPVITGIPVRYL